VTAAAGVSLLASDQGGFFPHTWPWAGLAFAAIAALVFIGTTPLHVTRAQLVLVAGLAALTAWTALSPLWSSEPGTSLQEAVRTSVYAAAALAFVALAAAGGTAGLLVGVACATTAIAAYSLADRAIHGVHAADAQGGLLEYPLGYANALGALCAIGLAIVLVLAVAERRRASGALAAVCVAAAVVLVVALLRTNSKGSLAAVVAGAGVALAFAVRRRWGAIAAGVLATLLAVMYVVTAFTAPRVLAARGDYWHVAWLATSHHPVVGDGAGTYDLAWAAFGDIARYAGALDAHNLYLEMLAELGVIGLLLTSTLVAPVVGTLHTARRTPIALAALAASVTFLVHAGLDWDWEMPAVTVAGLVCLAVAPGTSSGRAVVGRRLRITALGLAVAAILGYIVLIIARNVR
jgi:O-antigen ligase